MLVTVNLVNYLEVFNGVSLYYVINALYVTGMVYTDEDASLNV